MLHLMIISCPKRTDVALTLHKLHSEKKLIITHTILSSDLHPGLNKVAVQICQA